MLFAQTIASPSEVQGKNSKRRQMKTMKTLLTAFFLMISASGWAGPVSLGYTDHMDSPGSWSFAYGSPSFVSEATSPDPSTVMRWTFSAGMGDGVAPGIATINPGANRELYFQYYFKYSSNWTYHPVVNKQVYIWANNQNENFYMGVGQFSRGFKIDLQGTGGSKSIQDTAGVSIQSNRWYKVTAHIVINTGSNADGSAQVWIDDVSVINRTNLRFWNNADRFGNFAITPVWGGYQGDKVPSTQYLYIDELRIQTTPISGGSVGTTPPPPSQMQPAPPGAVSIQ